MAFQRRVSRRVLLLGTAILAVQAPTSAQSTQAVETVTVTGYKASLESALNLKRTSAEMIDAINAEDAAKFPDANLAEALQRLPGISITRDNGEGRTITVRGLGADFTRVTINGMEALATAGGTLAADNPNRTRQFDFNTFAAELFSSLKVRKTPSAATDEGSLGATVSLSTGHPFDYGDRYVASVNNAVYETGHAFNPRIAGLASQTWLGGRLGALVSVAYNLRHQALTYYTNGAGSYIYRVNNSSGSFAGTPTGTLTREGFAAPAGTSCSGANGVVPGVSVTNAYYCGQLSGSDPTAYSTINDPRGHIANSAGTWTTQAPSNEIGVPALADQDIYQSRVGITSSVQWQIDENTQVTWDGLFSSYYQNSTSNLLNAIGLSRNNTVAALNTATASTSLASNFSACTVYAATDLHAPQVCSYTNSQLPSTYYTTPGSAGYNSADPNGLKWLVSTIGRPAQKLIAGTVSNGIVNYLKTDNNDFRTQSDQSRATTQFSQTTLQASHSFSERLKVDALLGFAASRNHQEGLFATLDSIDRGSAKGDGYYIYDITGAGYAPKEISFGINAADPNSWDFVKGYSALRRYLFLTSNKFRNIALNIQYDPWDQFGLRFGFAQRIYQFNTTRYLRAVDTTLNPSLSELGLKIGDVSKVVSFDGGELGLGGATPTAFVSPDLNALIGYTGLRCNCVNQWGDWTISNLNAQNSSSNRTTTFSVEEHDKSYYLQADFKEIFLFGGEVRGNVGVRYATTEVLAHGFTAAGYAATGANSYDDILPSLNLVYSPTDDSLLRVGLSKVMSRPTLANMAPTITSISISSTLGASGSLSAGNPYLKPFRANTVDVSYEWYFDKGSVISVAAFAKYIKNNPQSQSISGKLADLISPDMITAIASNYTAGSNQYLNIYDPNVSYTLTSYLNAPGGLLEGIEVNYQQELNFLPDPFDGFGINANYTYVHSKMHYLIRTAGSTGLQDSVAPWTGSSPNSYNITLYYTAKNWEARVSTSYRSKFVDTYPVSSGSVAVGYGTSPAITEFIYGKSSFYLDTSFSYGINDHLNFKLDALNLTNQHTGKFWLYNGTTPRETYDSVSGRQVFAGVTLKY